MGAGSVGTALDVAPERRATVLGDAVADAVAPLSGWGAALYAVFAVSHVLILPPSLWQWLAPLASLTALAMALLARAATRTRPSASQSHPMLVAVVSAGLLNSAVHVALSRDPLQSTNFVLVFVAAGMVLLSRRAYALVVAVGFSAWLPIALRGPESPTWLHMGFAMLTAGVAGMVSVVFRQRTALRLAASQALLLEHEAKLERALHDARHELERRQRVEADLRQLSQELEARVERRTLELEESHRRLLAEMEERQSAERQVRAKSEQLQKAQRLETVGLLAGGVAHDFNNVLTVVMTCAELGRRRLPSDSVVRGLLDEIDTAAEQASQLTRQLLAFGRKQVLEPRPTNLNDVINKGAPLLRRLLGPQIELVLELAPQLDTTEIDVGQFEQVFVNLTLNARDAMPQGGRLTIRTASAQLEEGEHGELTAGRYVMCTISDTGMGMSDEIRARVFEPFFTTKGGGTGLGLASVHGIIKQSHGDIEVESASGVGTTFRIWLPGTDQRAKSLAGPSGERALPAAERARATVLLAEDNHAIRELMQLALQADGFEVLAAADGRSAMEQARALGRPIDLVVTDVMMPEMGGRELVEQLCAIQPGVRTLFMSAYAADELIRATPASHAVLQKPFSASTLVRKARELLAAS